MEWSARATGKRKVNPAKELRFRGGEEVGRSFAGSSWTVFSSMGTRFRDCDFTGFKAKTVPLGPGTEDSEYSNCLFDSSD